MDEFLNQVVVLDVEPLFVYVGTLTQVTEKTVTLESADVHDLRDSETTRERYILDSKVHGVRANRTKVLVQKCQVVSLSILDDVME